MKKIILISLTFFWCLQTFAQNFEIKNQNTNVSIISEGPSKRFLFDDFAICVYDSIGYFVYHNWITKENETIKPHEYTRAFQKLNNTTLEEKQKRCETLRNSQHIAIIELPDSILKLSHSYTNDLLQVTCIKGERFSSVRDTAIVKTSLKNLKMFFGYGGLGGKKKKPVLILYK